MRGTPACAGQTSDLEPEVQVVAYRALQALPLGTRTPVLLDPATWVKIGSKIYKALNEHRRGSF